MACILVAFAPFTAATISISVAVARGAAEERRRDDLRVAYLQGPCIKHGGHLHAGIGMANEWDAVCSAHKHIFEEMSTNE